MRVIPCVVWIAGLCLMSCGGGESSEGGDEGGTPDVSDGDSGDASDPEDTPPPPPDVPDNTDTSEETGGGVVCKTGEVIGGTCDPGTEVGAECAAIWIDGQDCSGNPIHLETSLLVGGGFVFDAVPVGVQVVQVQVGAVAAECNVIVEAEKKAFVGTNQCTCDPVDCGSLFAATCWESLDEDGCNCKDDDCDGVVDEDCVDDCNCQDDDCDGVVDEDCVDDCDGVDDDCDGVTDENCPFVNDCTNPEVPFDDCDQNDVPDQCPVCPPLEVVFVIDTSGSMHDELAALCEGIDTTIATLGVVNIETTAELLGITQTLDCTHETVEDTYGTIAAGAPPDLPEMADCANGTENSEDWGPAIAVIAANKPWSEGALRIIVPISDEGPVCGTPVDAEDYHVIDTVSEVALAHNVVIYPITGTGTPANVIEIAQGLAEGTGGVWKATTDPENDLANLVLANVFDACESVSDCNGNGVPDSCDLTEGAADCNANVIPDVCDVAVGGVPDCDASGVPDSCELANGTVPDCNANEVPDSCDIASEVSVDVDGNGVPDECGGASEETGEEADAG